MFQTIKQLLTIPFIKWFNKKETLLPLKDIIFLDKKGREHILTKQTQELWIKTFNLKSLYEEFIPNIPKEVKDSLGKEVRINFRDLEKIVEIYYASETLSPKLRDCSAHKAFTGFPSSTNEIVHNDYTKVLPNSQSNSNPTDNYIDSSCGEGQPHVYDKDFSIYTDTNVIFKETNNSETTTTFKNNQTDKEINTNDIEIDTKQNTEQDYKPPIRKRHRRNRETED